MHTPSRLILTAAVAGAAILAPLVAAAAPAFADGARTTGTITVTPLLSTEQQGTLSTVAFDLTEDPGGDPSGLHGTLTVVQMNAGGVAIDESYPVGSADTRISQFVDSAKVGPVEIIAQFTPDSDDQLEAQGRATVHVYGTAALAVTNTAVTAGDSIVVNVSEPGGSAGAGGTVAATASGAGLTSCAPTATSATTASCTLQVSKYALAGTDPITLSYVGSPLYLTATLKTSLTITEATDVPESGTGDAATETTGSKTTETTGSATTETAGSATAGAAGAARTDAPAAAAAPASKPVTASTTTSQSTAGRAVSNTAPTGRSLGGGATRPKLRADAPAAGHRIGATPVGASTSAVGPTMTLAGASVPMSPLLVAGVAVALIFLVLIALVAVLLRSTRKRTL